MPFLRLISSLFLFFFLRIALILHICHTSRGIKTRPSFQLGLQYRFASCLKELTLLELDLTLDFLALDIRDQE